MKKFRVFTFWTIVCVALSHGGSTQRTTNICGDWTPYKNEKCLKIAGRAGTQTQADGEVICKSYADDLNNDSIPKLITIKTKEEQDFVQRFLFAENEIVDNVWLGLVKNRNSQLFDWNDGSQLSFSNWANVSISDNEHECVQMDSGDGTSATGVWLKVSCKRRNLVVCERIPSWTFETLQNAFLNFKLEQDRKVMDLQLELANSVEEQKNLKQELANSVEEQKELKEELGKKTNSVPLGFIYAQLPDQVPPTILWPNTTWLDVSSNYSGIFFRVIGGNAAGFGEMQEETSPRLHEVSVTNRYDAGSITIPADGTWSKFCHTGGTSTTGYGFRFRHSTAELRPRNKSIKIWKRI